jgi:cation:H+ antiporter
MIVPIQVVDQELLSLDVFWMLGISILILPLVFFPKGMRLSWPDGLLLLTCYSLFVYHTIS